ncbi:MAG: AraC family transcriptional regulator [Lacunisphaera sp.]|nr:AraC family transcriptional regulator [Lacunisphaera sp.]
MPDMRGEVFSFPIDLLRVSAPRLEQWRVLQPVLPCWRLWWNSNSGASVVWRGARTELGPRRFVLVAPETPFAVQLRRPIGRHLFIHFSLAAARWKMTDAILGIGTCGPTHGLVQALLAKLSPDPEIAIAEPLLGVALASAVLSKVETSHWEKPPADTRVRNVIAALERDLGTVWSNGRMARVAALSPGGFIRLFRQEVGTSPQGYLLRERLNRARTLLLQTELSIEDVTERCGFCDRSYFSTVFRREIGVPPAAFRAQSRWTI